MYCHHIQLIKTAKPFENRVLMRIPCMKKGVEKIPHAQSYHFLGKIELEPSTIGVGLCYFVDCDDVSSDSHRHIVLNGSLIHIIKRIFHDSV